MARKSNTRAAQGSGTIRKKTVTRKGQQYTYWEGRVTIGHDRNRETDTEVLHWQDAEGGPGKDTGGRRGCQ